MSNVIRSNLFAPTTVMGAYSCALGREATATEDGEWAFGILGVGNVLQVFPDGRVLVRGRAPENDAEIVEALKRACREAIACR